MSSETILVVDDEARIRDAIASALEATGYQVLRATSGWHALELAATYGLDLVIAEETMSRLSGLELSRRLRLNSATSSIPIILLTAQTQEERSRGPQTSEINAFVTKPVDFAALRRTVAELIASGPGPGAKRGLRVMEGGAGPADQISSAAPIAPRLDRSEPVPERLPARVTALDAADAADRLERFSNRLADWLSITAKQLGEGLREQAATELIQIVAAGRAELEQARRSVDHSLASVTESRTAIETWSQGLQARIAESGSSARSEMATEAQRLRASLIELNEQLTAATSVVAEQMRGHVDAARTLHRELELAKGEATHAASEVEAQSLLERQRMDAAAIAVREELGRHRDSLAAEAKAAAELNRELAEHRQSLEALLKNAGSVLDTATERSFEVAQNAARVQAEQEALLDLEVRLAAIGATTEERLTELDRMEEALGVGMQEASLSHLRMADEITNARVEMQMALERTLQAETRSDQFQAEIANVNERIRGTAASIAQRERELETLVAEARSLRVDIDTARSAAVGDLRDRAEEARAGIAHRASEVSKTSHNVAEAAALAKRELEALRDEILAGGRNAQAEAHRDRLESASAQEERFRTTEQAWQRWEERADAARAVIDKGLEELRAIAAVAQQHQANLDATSRERTHELRMVADNARLELREHRNELSNELRGTVEALKAELGEKTRSLADVMDRMRSSYSDLSTANRVDAEAVAAAAQAKIRAAEIAATARIVNSGAEAEGVLQVRRAAVNTELEARMTALLESSAAIRDEIESTWGRVRRRQAETDQALDARLDHERALVTTIEAKIDSLEHERAELERTLHLRRQEMEATADALRRAMIESQGKAAGQGRWRVLVLGFLVAMSLIALGLALYAAIWR